MITRSQFKPAWWLKNPHAQTLWPFLFRRRPKLDVELETVELPDGDFLDIAWLVKESQPLVLVLHGLEGSIQSHYAANLLQQLDQAGYSVVFMHFRGCSGRPNRLDRSYHSGDTNDLAYLVNWIKETKGRRVEAAIGYSLGGNVLLKWLGETGGGNTLKFAVAISVPFSLNDIAKRLEKGASRLYQSHLLSSLRKSYTSRFADRASPLSVDVQSLRTFRQYDNEITAPLNGFQGVDHYYTESSSKQYINHIKVPTLILHAMDDPFMWRDTVPKESELSDAVTLEIAEHGGHVGFISGRYPGVANYWLEQRIIQAFNEILR